MCVAAFCSQCTNGSRSLACMVAVKPAFCLPLVITLAQAILCQTRHRNYGCQAMMGKHGFLACNHGKDAAITLGHDATQSFGQARNVAVHVKTVVILTCCYLPLTPPTTASTSRRCEFCQIRSTLGAILDQAISCTSASIANC